MCVFLTWSGVLSTFSWILEELIPRGSKEDRSRCPVAEDGFLTSVGAGNRCYGDVAEPGFASRLGILDVILIYLDSYLEISYRRSRSDELVGRTSFASWSGRGACVGYASSIVASFLK